MDKFFALWNKMPTNWREGLGLLLLINGIAASAWFWFKVF